MMRQVLQFRIATTVPSFATYPSILESQEKQNHLIRGRVFDEKLFSETTSQRVGKVAKRAKKQRALKHYIISQLATNGEAETIAEVEALARMHPDFVRSRSLPSHYEVPVTLLVDMRTVGVRVGRSAGRCRKTRDPD